ncbi:MAG: class IV adenylate cyclase [Actinobacteria bacterium]|nr:class IV adenylate cyclase [Actinomycetota bacterium]
MATETEAKIRVADHEPLRARLIQLGASAQGQQVHVDIYFDTAEGRLRKTDTALRLRCAGQTSVLTYKGPREEGRYKQRQEIETAVADTQAIKSLLEQLGFTQSLLLEKSRESWLMDRCRVELDTLPLLGTFVEIEGPSPEDITGVIERLQLDSGNSITTPYPTLVREHLQKIGNPSRQIRLTEAGS